LACGNLTLSGELIDGLDGDRDGDDDGDRGLDGDRDRDTSRNQDPKINY